MNSMSIHFSNGTILPLVNAISCETISKGGIHWILIEDATLGNIQINVNQVNYLRLTSADNQTETTA